jgi:hypothetical protein
MGRVTLNRREVMNAIDDDLPFELTDCVDRAPALGCANERAPNISFKTALSPNALGQSLRQRRSSTNRRSSRFVVRIAWRCVMGESQVRNAGFEVVHEAPHPSFLLAAVVRY